MCRVGRRAGRRNAQLASISHASGEGERRCERRQSQGSIHFVTSLACPAVLAKSLAAFLSGWAGDPHPGLRSRGYRLASVRIDADERL
jgi:hypothetical protein